MSSPLLAKVSLPQIPSNALGFHHSSAISFFQLPPSRTYPCTWPVTYDLCTLSLLPQSPAGTAAAKSPTEAVDLRLRAALAPNSQGYPSPQVCIPCQVIGQDPPRCFLEVEGHCGGKASTPLPVLFQCEDRAGIGTMHPGYSRVSQALKVSATG